MLTELVAPAGKTRVSWTVNVSARRFVNHQQAAGLDVAGLLR